MNATKHLHWPLLLLFLLGACARQSAPTGGPKDTIPPRLLTVHPAHETTNFNAKKIELEFTEDVILNAPKEQLIVTPTINKDYEITYRRNRVIITLEEPLLDSTTYTFNFREAIVDITEKNPAPRLLVAYSTGDYIDSLQIRGQVRHMLRGTIPKDATVALHPKNDTFNIFEHPAPYFTKTDPQGNFLISHLQPGSYFVYAFEDKNKNLVVNSRNESYGFLAQEIDLRENHDSVALNLVQLNAGALNLISARPYNTYFNIRTSKALRSFLVTPLDTAHQLVATYGEDQANIRIYDTFEPDSLQIHLLAIDSIDNAIDTTLYAKFLDRASTPENFTLSITHSSLLPHRGKLQATMQFSKPITSIAFDSIWYQVDSLTRINFEPSSFSWNETNRRLTLDAPIDASHFPAAEAATTRRARPHTSSADQPEGPKPIHELYFGQAAFLSIEQDSSARLAQPLQPKLENQSAIINVTIQTDAPNFAVQLLDNQYKIVQEIRDRTRIRFTDVAPGDYRIRMIVDTNNNGRWDPGNYFTRTEPEPVIYYTAPDGNQTVKGVKANWEIGTDGEMLISW